MITFNIAFHIKYFMSLLLPPLLMLSLSSLCSYFLCTREKLSTVEWQKRRNNLEINYYLRVGLKYFCIHRFIQCTWLFYSIPVLNANQIYWKVKFLEAFTNGLNLFASFAACSVLQSTFLCLCAIRLTEYPEKADSIDSANWNSIVYFNLNRKEITLIKSQVVYYCY